MFPFDGSNSSLSTPKHQKRHTLSASLASSKPLSTAPSYSALNLQDPDFLDEEDIEIEAGNTNSALHPTGGFRSMDNNSNDTAKDHSQRLGDEEHHLQSSGATSHDPKKVIHHYPLSRGASSSSSSTSPPATKINMTTTAAGEVATDSASVPRAPVLRSRTPSSSVAEKQKQQQYQYEDDDEDASEQDRVVNIFHGRQSDDRNHGKRRRTSGTSSPLPGGRTTVHIARYWKWYAAVMVLVIVGLIIAVVLLAIRPWDKPSKLSPVENEAIKSLPPNQPLWPMPQKFSFGGGGSGTSFQIPKEFTIRVQQQQQTEGAAAGGGAASTTLAKALQRALDRISARRNMTAEAVGAVTTGHEALSSAEYRNLLELVIVVKDTSVILGPGVDESYELAIQNLEDHGSTAGTGVSSGNGAGAVPSIPPPNQKRSPITSGTGESVQEETIAGAGPLFDSSMLLPTTKRVLNKSFPLAAPASTIAQSLVSRAITNNQTLATLTASTVWGAIQGLETFLQLVTASSTTLEPETVTLLEIPNIPWSIQDGPKFSHRGLLLDTSRNYYPVADILRTLDAMSFVKLNVFHWHILDQQTYPLVSTNFPLLSQNGAQSPARIYTAQDVAQVVDFAMTRSIRVLPEFDAPGHAASWGRSYPNITTCLDMLPHSTYSAEPPAGQLDPLEPFTYEVLNKLVPEWANLFPDQQVHAGGDEINMNCWKTNDRVQDYLQNPSKRQGYEDALLPPDSSSANFSTTKKRSGEDELLNVFLKRSFGMYKSQQKIPVVWEELALEHAVDLPAGTPVQVWKNAGNAKRVIEQGYPVILSSAEYWYLDCGSGNWLVGGQGSSWCPYASWQRIYSYSFTDTLSADQQTKVLGGEICMWSEQTDANNLDSSLWPRSAAAAEVMWSGSQDDQGNKRPLLHAVKRLSHVREWMVNMMGVRAAPLFPSWCIKNPEACLAE